MGKDVSQPYVGLLYILNWRLNKVLFQKSCFYINGYGHETTWTIIHCYAQNLLQYYLGAAKSYIDLCSEKSVHDGFLLILFCANLTDRVGSEFWKQSEVIGGEERGIMNTLTKTERGEPVVFGKVLFKSLLSVTSCWNNLNIYPYHWNLIISHVLAPSLHDNHIGSSYCDYYDSCPPCRPTRRFLCFVSLPCIYS